MVPRLLPRLYHAGTELLHQAIFQNLGGSLQTSKPDGFACLFICLFVRVPLFSRLQLNCALLQRTPLPAIAAVTLS